MTVPSPASTASTGRRRVAAMQAPAITAPTTTTKTQNANTPPLRSKWNGPARYVASRKPSNHSAAKTSSPTAHRKRSRIHRSSTMAARARTIATTITTLIVGPTRSSRKRPSSLAFTRDSVRSASDAPGRAGLHAPALHRVGPVEPEVGEDGRCDVGEVDEPVALRGGGAQETGLEAGAAHRGDAERVAFLRRRRAHDHDQVAGLDVVEQSADDAVGVLERAGAHLHRLLVGGEPGLDVGPHEVGSFDQHHRARSERVGEGAFHPIGIEANTERGGGVLSQQAVVDATVGHLARAGHQRGHGGAAPRRGAGVGRAGVGAVAVGDHRPGDPGGGQLVTEQSGLGAEELAVVGVDGVGDRHVHEAVARGDAGAGGEHHTGGVAPEVLVDAEALVAGRAVADGARAGADGHVPAGQRRGTIDAVGDHGTDRRRGEQLVEVGRRRLLEVGPLGVGQRHDQHASLLRRRRARGPGRTVRPARRPRRPRPRAHPRPPAPRASCRSDVPTVAGGSGRGWVPSP